MPYTSKNFIYKYYNIIIYSLYIYIYIYILLVGHLGCNAPGNIKNKPNQTKPNKTKPVKHTQNQHINYHILYII